MQAINAVARAYPVRGRCARPSRDLSPYRFLSWSGFVTVKAQQTNATIVGNVTDTTGAVVAGAKGDGDGSVHQHRPHYGHR